MSLAELNATLHATLDGLLLDVLEHLTRADHSAARTAFDHFVQALHAHADLEEARIFPLADQLDLEAKAKPAILERDHDIIRRSIDAVDALLHTIAASDNPRRAFVSGLEPCVRLRRVLEHHGVRECEFFYPHLDAHLGPSQRDALAAALRDALPPALAQPPETGQN